VCPDCSGTGVTHENQGFFGFSRPCAKCNGAGHLIDNPCLLCRGGGKVHEPHEVRIRIPAGVSDNDTIRVAGKGAASPGGPPGDLMVRVHVAKHKRFARSGDNLLITLPITITEAALGSKLKVPTLEGGSVTLKIPAGTSPNQTFRVKGRGVTTAKNSGDLLVTVEVVIPTNLTVEQRALLEQLHEMIPSPRGSHESD
jgi:molecular chaperone DnaJ